MNIKTVSFNEFLKHHKCATPLEYILEILPKCNVNGPWVAGGSLLRTYTGMPLDSDIDLFFSSESMMQEYVNNIIQGSMFGKYTTKDYIVTEWHQSLTVSYLNRDWKIQCVSFVYFKDIVELFSSFDFNICMWAYDGENVHTCETTVDAVNSKTIKINKINYPSVTLKRLVKYMRQGYNISDEDVVALCRSFGSKKEPRGIMDDSFGKKTYINNSDYKALIK